MIHLALEGLEICLFYRFTHHTIYTPLAWMSPFRFTLVSKRYEMLKYSVYQSTAHRRRCQFAAIKKLPNWGTAPQFPVYNRLNGSLSVRGLANLLPKGLTRST